MPTAYLPVRPLVLQPRLDKLATTFVDNNYEERLVMYFNAELEL